MCSKVCKFEPTHVYANICPRLLAESSDQNQKQSEPEARRVEVSGTAECTTLPDQYILTVIISNKKEKAEEARTSVTRRLEYVTQMLYNYGLQKCDVDVTKNMSRVNGRGCFSMEAQVDALFHNDLHKCLQLKNLFIEKLDKSVKILPVTLQHNKQHVDAIRKKTCMNALTNAREKASELCRIMGQCLGRPVFITENIIREWKGEENKESPCVVIGGSTCSRDELDVQRRMKEQSITIKVDVTATFDIRCKFEKKKETKVNCKNKY